MREIKCRAWDVKNKKWLEAGQSLLGYLVAWKTSNSFEILGRGDYEIVQYTGLKDKNGKEIYEKDVIEWLDPFGTTVRSQVIYDETTASYKTYRGELSHISIRPNLKVIGNIYENSELLEKELSK